MRHMFGDKFYTADFVLQIVLNNILGFITYDLNYKTIDYGCNTCTFYHPVARWTLRKSTEDDSLMTAETVSRYM